MRSSQKKETRPHTSVHGTSGFASMMATHACTVSSVEASVCGARRGTNSPPSHFLCTTEHSRQFWTLALRPCSLQSNNQRFRSLRSCQSKCAGKEVTTVLPSWCRSLSALFVTLASHLTMPPSDISDLSFPMEKAVAVDCGANMSPELIPSP